MSVLRIDQVLARLVPASEDFSLERWAQRLEEFEGRAIHFVGIDLPPGCFGACVIVTEESEGRGGIRYPATEYVVYAEGLSPAHREHVKAHELAHITLGHRTLVLSPAQLAERDLSAALADDLPHFCCRAASPSDPASYLRTDLDAERLTRLIYQRVLLTRQRRGLTHYSSQQEFDLGLQRLGIG